jgi:hypothetical protein
MLFIAAKLIIWIIVLATNLFYDVCHLLVFFFYLLLYLCSASYIIIVLNYSVCFAASYSKLAHLEHYTILNLALLYGDRGFKAPW